MYLKLIKDKRWLIWYIECIKETMFLECIKETMFKIL